MARFGLGWWLDGRFSPALTAPGTGGGGLPNTMVVELASGYLYARFPWDATYDAVQRITVTAVPASDIINGVTQPSQIRRIAIATSRTGMVAAFNAAVGAADIFVGEVDVAPPVKYNNTFIGGNHGALASIRVTATAHGKTVADIGSEWSDGTKSVWIIAILDANTLVCMLNNIGTNDSLWFFFTNLSAGTLTHVAGATNTGSVSFSAPSARQIFPSVRDHVQTVKLNGVTTVSVDGVYDCNYVTVEESYDIVNPELMRDYLIAGRPWATTPSVTDPAIASQVSLRYVYEVHDNGSMSVAGRFENLQTIDLSSGDGFAGFIQAQTASWAAGVETMSLYVPRTTAIVGSLKTWNFENCEVISGAFEQIDFTKARWTNVANPPDRMVELVKNTASGINQKGYAIGYSRLSGAGANLANYIVKSGYISAARKMYPHILTKQAPAFGAPASTLPVNSVVEATAYRILYNLSAIPEATTAAVRLFEGGAEVILDFHQNVTAKAVPVPAKLNGKTVTIVDGNGNLTLDSAVVTAGAITVSVTGSYGAAVLQVA